MKHKAFWEEIEKRAEENRWLTHGGLPDFLHPLVVRGGLHFWPIGAGVALVVAGCLWRWRFAQLVEVGLWLLRL